MFIHRHSAALEASSEDMHEPAKPEESSPPYQNGSTARRRRRQRAGDEASGKGQDKTADTRQPLLALEGARSETESDDEPTSRSPRRYKPRPPVSADVEFAPQPPPSRLHTGRKGATPKGNGHTQKAPTLPLDRANPSTYNVPELSVGGDSANTTPKSDIADHRPAGSGAEDDQLASYPPPPPFEEIYPRSPTGPNGVPDSSVLHSPSITPPPPPHVPSSSSMDPFSQEASDKQYQPESDPGMVYFPPPPAQSPDSSPGGQQDSSPYTPAHRQSDSNKPATDPKSSKPHEKRADIPLTSSTEDDNDISLRRQRSNDGNMYVNVDNIVGKETYF